MQKKNVAKGIIIKVGGGIREIDRPAADGLTGQHWDSPEPVGLGPEEAEDEDCRRRW